MNLASVRYRVSQFWLALRVDAPSQADLAPARALLTPEQMTLFSHLQPSEQRHSLRVLADLQAAGETHPDLMIAALLHDIGKIRYPLRLWQRVFIVLAKAVWPTHSRAWGQNQPQGWRTIFAVAAQHPAWGANLALEAGVSPQAANLIRQHQNPLATENQVENRLLAALQKADRRH